MGIAHPDRARAHGGAPLRRDPQLLRRERAQAAARCTAERVLVALEVVTPGECEGERLSALLESVEVTGESPVARQRKLVLAGAAVGRQALKQRLAAPGRRLLQPAQRIAEQTQPARQVGWHALCPTPALATHSDSG